jgi:hypothetical protein
MKKLAATSRGRVKASLVLRANLDSRFDEIGFDRI